jgi:hypothetical protein
VHAGRGAEAAGRRLAGEVGRPDAQPWDEASVYEGAKDGAQDLVGLVWWVAAQDAGWSVSVCWLVEGGLSPRVCAAVVTATTREDASGPPSTLSLEAC